jgi:hypothetical protein
MDYYKAINPSMGIGDVHMIPGKPHAISKSRAKVKTAGVFHPRLP